MALSELRQTLRRLARQPGFTTAAVLSLALGIGATVTMFSIVNGVLLQPLAFREPARLYTAQIVFPRSPKRENWPVNARHFSEWRTHCRNCESVAMVGGLGLSLTGEGEPQRLSGLRVSYNFFQTLGVRPAMGRDFRSDEELPGHFGEVILSDPLWRSKFGADSHVIGRKLILNGEPHEVVGVMPASLRLPKGAEWGPGMANSLQPAIFRPLGMNVAQAEPVGSNNYVVLVRTKVGVTARQAEAELNSLLQQFAPLYRMPMLAALIPMQDAVTAGSRSALWLLLGAVGTLMAMVCVNVGNLMLLRTTARSREVGIRTALGSGRRHLFGLVLQEAAVLVAIGTGSGWLLAVAGLQLFRTLAPVDLPRLDEVQLDGHTLAFLIALAAVSTLICGLFPAWRMTRIAPMTSLKSGSQNVTAGSAKFRLREFLVSIEVALSALLLIAGALFTVSFYRVIQADRGIETAAHIVTQDVSLIHPKYAQGRRNLFLTEVLSRLREIPGVDFAGLTTQLPLRGSAWTSSMSDGARPNEPGNTVGLGQFRFVSAGYAEAMGIRLKSGRLLTDADSGRRVAVLSDLAAEMLWPGQNPIGRSVWSWGTTKAPFEVVGVVGAVRAETEAKAPPTVYEPAWVSPEAGVSFTLRTREDSNGVARALQGVLREMDPELPLTPTRTMDQILDEAVAVRRFETKLVAAFAVAALLLAVIGVYGVLAFSVARRTSEMGIRLALGSPAQLIIAMIVRQGMTPVLIGLAAGVAGALALGRVLASQLYEVTPRDPLTIAAVVAGLLLAGLAASYLPARRASRTDPLQALRFE